MYESQHLKALKQHLAGKGFTVSPEVYRPELLLGVEVDRARMGTVVQEVTGTEAEEMLALLNNAAGYINLPVLKRGYPSTHPYSLRRTDFQKGDARVVYDLCTTVDITCYHPITEQGTPEEIEEFIAKHCSTAAGRVEVFKKGREIRSPAKSLDSALAGCWRPIGSITYVEDGLVYSMLRRIDTFLKKKVPF